MSSSSLGAAQDSSSLLGFPGSSVASSASSLHDNEHNAPVGNDASIHTFQTNQHSVIIPEFSDESIVVGGGLGGIMLKYQSLLSSKASKISCASG